jgi:hypothetical protein
VRRTAIKRKPPLRRKPAEVIQADLWRSDLGPCLFAGRDLCEGPVEGHHAILRQTLRHEGHVDHVWDRRNRVALCSRHHRRFHLGLLTINQRQLPPPVLEFAEELGLGWVIEKRYPPGCRDCGETVINWGAHMEACRGPVVRCVDPEREWIDDQRALT